MAGRARRLKHDRDHLISRRLVDAYPHSRIGLEELSNIGERTRRKRGKRGKRGKRASAQQRRANRHASAWACSEVQSYLAYTAVLAGSRAVKVDAYHTSQACPRCGYTSPDNRPEPGEGVGVQVPGVPLYPPCRSRCCTEHHPKNASRSARLGENERLVRTP